jgi:DNA mismatch repair ATPase MutS
MKAFLMYRDRDFDPKQLIVRREKEYRPRVPDRTLDLEQLLPWNEQALRQDLGLDIVFNAMALNDNFLFEVAKVAILNNVTDVDAIFYRQYIFSDCLKNGEIVKQIYEIAVAAIQGERKNYWSFFSRYPGGVLHRAVEVLQMLVGMLRKLRGVADRHAEAFESEGFLRLFAMLKEELSDEYFATIEKHLRQLKFRNGALISAEQGKGNKGKNYVLRKPNEDTRGWITRLLAEKPPSYTFTLHPRDEGGHQALSALNDRGLNLVANALAQSTDHILSFFEMLRTELAFYIGALNLHAQLCQMGEAVCLPVPAPAGKQKLAFSGLYDISLALSSGKKVIGNDLRADGKRLFIITGANTGGKSTFLRSVGLAHLMMQAGMFVPAEALSSDVAELVFTHYKREEDTTMESGKWDEELGRMSEIVDRMKSNSLLLFNESFASTNEREGSEIANHIVRALLDRNVKVFFVTHLYHFAQGFFARKLDHVAFLRAERRPDGTRPFKLIEAGPLQTSYGEDLYRTVFGGDERPSVSSETTEVPVRQESSPVA